MINLKEYKEHLDMVEFNIEMLNRHYDYLIDSGENSMEVLVSATAELQENIDYLIWVKSHLTQEIEEHNPKASDNITVYDSVEKKYSIVGGE